MDTRKSSFSARLYGVWKRARWLDTWRSFFWSRLRDLRGIWSRARWLAPKFWLLALAATTATLTYLSFSAPKGELLLYLSDPDNYSPFFEAIGLGTLLLSGVLLWNRIRADVVFERHAALDVSLLQLAPGEQVLPFGTQSIIYRSDVNALLEDARNPIHFDKNMFQPHPLVREMLSLFLIGMPETKLDTSDSPKLRLVTDPTPRLLRSGAEVELQRSSYYRDRLSNTLANYEVRLENRVLLDLRHEVIANGRLISLKASKLSNQLGGSVILITADAAIVYLRQGNRTDENAGRLAPSGSGSFDLPDKRQLGLMSFQELARQQSMRELCEECGLDPSDVHALQLCGFGRFLYRNGKPEMFCIATTRLRSSAIRVPAREWDYQQRTSELFSFDGPVTAETAAQALDDLRLRLEQPDFKPKTSGPLYWNVVFARDYLRQVGAAKAEDLFGRL